MKLKEGMRIKIIYAPNNYLTYFGTHTIHTIKWHTTAQCFFIPYVNNPNNGLSISEDQINRFFIIVGSIQRNLPDWF